MLMLLVQKLLLRILVWSETCVHECGGHWYSIGRIAVWLEARSWMGHLREESFSECGSQGTFGGSHFHEWHCGAVTNQGISVGLESHFGIPDNHLLPVPVNLAGMCLDSGQERAVCTKKTLVIHVTEQFTYLSECSRTMEPVTDLLRSNKKKTCWRHLFNT